MRTEILVPQGKKIEIAKICNTTQPTLRRALRGEEPVARSRKLYDKIRRVAIENGGVEKTIEISK